MGRIIWKLGPVNSLVEAVMALPEATIIQLRCRTGNVPVAAHLCGYTARELSRIGERLDQRYPALYRSAGGLQYLTSSKGGTANAAAIFPPTCTYERARTILADALA